ncbi:membrane-spanning 4-domains subfamily A member 8-like [Anomaloglossus baeobatrachus]|uniref:membrane-spanning 4-domains subfamily A member 8-like n=1 Tax=Anomaloglossus baeobatrachus TaxID=238106 RepID=UPI003F5082D2
MSSPTTENRMHSYEPVPCTIILPKEDAASQKMILPENMQSVSLASNVYPVPPVVAAAVPQTTLSTAIHQKFVKEKTQELAILLIVASIVQFFLGIGTLFTNVHFILFSGVPFWGTVCYLVAGSLTISVQGSPSICLVKGSLALNILGAILSCIGIIMACLDIVSITSIECSLHIIYQYLCPKPETGDIVIFSLILITNVLLFCVSISIAVFGCRSLSVVSTVPQVYLVQNGVVVPAPTPSFPATTVAFTTASPSHIGPVE